MDVMYIFTILGDDKISIAMSKEEEYIKRRVGMWDPHISVTVLYF